MNQVQSTERVKTATAQAAAASKQLDMPVGRTRRNLFHVYVTLDPIDEVGTKLVKLGSFKNTTEINAALSALTDPLADVQVIFGHERKAKRQTKVVFK